MSPPANLDSGGADVPAKRPRVWISNVETYDTHAVRVGVSKGLDYLRVDVRGNAVAIADWTDATGAAVTRPEVVEAAFDVLLGRESEIFFVVTGRSAPGLSGRRTARNAPGALRRGFFEIPRLHPGRVRVRPADEARRYRYQLSVGERTPRDADPASSPLARLDDRIPGGWELFHADAVVAFPKLTRDLRCGLCGAVALVAGLGRVAPMYSDHAGRRAADAAEVSWPDLVVTDAVHMGWGGSRRTQPGRPLGVVIVADDALAHDVVAAHLLGLDPASIPSLALLAERGYGSLDLDGIDLDGDVGLDILRDRLLGFGPPAPPLSEAAERYEAATGIAAAVVVRSSVGDDDPCARLVADRLAAAWDDPDSREALKTWPRTVLRIGDGACPSDAGTQHLVGDAAVEAFRRDHPEARTVLRLPRWLRRWDGPTEVLRWRRADGQRGNAFALPGAPPTARALQRSLFVGSWGRIRGPWGRFWWSMGHALASLGTTVRRSIRNREGVPVVHARKIARLRTRPWRLRWATPPALELHPDLLPTTAALDAPADSPTVPGSNETDLEP
jgi:uncharacterized protein (DUF362 family)